MNILNRVASLNEVEARGLIFIMGEVGSGKTTFLKSMPDAADGDILYIPIGNDKGFNQLKSDERFKTLIDDDGNIKPVKTVYVMKKGKRIAIKERVIPQIIELLEALVEDNKKTFKGFTLDAISTLQELIETEIKFETKKNVDWDGWSAIKKGMNRVYELCEELDEMGYEVALQSHFQVRDHTDQYSGETMSRVLPMMTEGNAVRILKNAAAVVFIKVMPDPKDPKVVRRMSIVGGHPTIPTKLRNEHNLSFDGILFENLHYESLITLSQIESLEDAADLEDLQIKREGTKPKKKKSTKKTEEEVVEEVKPKAKKKVKKPVVEEVEEIDEDEVEEEVVKPKKTKTKVKKKVEPVVEEDEDDEEEEETPAPKKIKKKVKKKVVEVEDEEDEEEEEVKPTRKKLRKPKTVEIDEDDSEDKIEEDEEEVKPKKKKAKVKKKVVEVEEDEDDDFDDDFEDDDLFDEED